MKKSGITIASLGFGHGLNDFIAGYFLGRLVQSPGQIVQVGMGLLLYNLLAFGGQYPVALWLEKLASPRRPLILAYTLNIIAVACFPFVPQISIILAGVASAIYHVAGGAVCASENKATHIGIFAAPGVAGLILGGWVAYNGINIIGWLLAVAALFLVILFFLKLERKSPSVENSHLQHQKFSLDGHDIIMILLLTIISMRSVIWNVFQLIHQNDYGWLLAIGGAAFAGKIAGGWIADRIGWRFWLYISMLLATPLITLFRKEMILFCIGIGLLQSGIPATTALLIRSMRGKTERSVALSFGTAIMAAAILFYTPARIFLQSNTILFVLAGLMLLLLYFSALKKERRPAAGII